MKIKYGWLIAIFLLVVVVLFNRSDVQLVKQDAFKLVNIGQEGYELQSVLHFSNPNLLSSTIVAIREKYYINDRLIGELNNEVEQGISGRKETTLPVGVRFLKKDFRQLAAVDSISSSSPVEVTIKGEITFRNFTGGGTIVVNQTTTITP